MTPGLPIEEVFKNVRQDLGRQTGGKQIPWELSSLEGKFYFNDQADGGRDLTAASKKVDDERQRIAQERYLIEKQKSLEEEREKLETLKREQGKPSLPAGAKKEVALVPQPHRQPGEGVGFIDPTTGMEFVFVKGGCYEMGDTFGDDYDNEKPVHTICVPDFYIGKYEVTQGQWRQLMGNNPSSFKNCGITCPVESVSWNDTQEFIGKLNRGRVTACRLRRSGNMLPEAGGRGRSGWARTLNQIWDFMPGMVQIQADAPIR
jgi:hypothetical protein